MEKEITGPYETYLFVTNDKEGTEYVMEIKEDELLDIETLISKWIKQEFGDEVHLVQPFDFNNKIFGDYYAVIITDWRPKDSIVVWEGAYFFIESSYE